MVLAGLPYITLATQYGHTEIMKYLVDQQLCSPLAKNELHQPPLHLACIITCNNREITLEMIVFLTTNTHADCNAQTKEGCSPLILQVNRSKNCWNDTVHYLIFQCYCDLSLNSIGETALHIACTDGNMDVVGMIIDRGFPLSSLYVRQSAYCAKNFTASLSPISPTKYAVHFLNL